jgi:hypothetical protein
LRSFIFFSAIARSWVRVILPIVSRPGLARTRLQVQRLLDEVGRRRRLGDEGERLVLVDRDHGRQRRAALFLLGAGVELLAEAHDVDARWPSAGPMGGEGVAAPAGTCSLI